MLKNYIVSLASALLFTVGCANAQEVNITFATQNIPGTAVVKAAKLFADTVNEAGAGKVKVTINDSLLTAAQIAPAVRDGRVEMVALLHPYLSANEPFMGLQNLPGMINSRDEFVTALNAGWREQLDTVLKDDWKSIELVGGVLESNFLFTSRPITKVEDFQGLKLRVSSLEAGQYVQALGGSPTAIDPSEMLAGLERGVIDGLFTGVCFADRVGIWRSAKYVSNWRAGPVTGWSLLINEGAWNRIPAEVQQILTKAGESTEEAMAADYEAFTGACVDALEAHGAELVEVPQSEINSALGRDAVRQIWDTWADRVSKKGMDGKAFLARVQAAVTATRK